MSEIRDTLKKLFSRNVVIKALPGGRVKTYDISKSQSIGSPTTYSNRAKWRNGRSFNSVSGYGSGFTNEEIEAIRRQMYLDYELMDTDAIVSSALDIFAEECLGGSTVIPLLDGRKISIKELHEKDYQNFWIYGIDELGNFKPIKAQKVAYNGKREVYEIGLDDGTVIKCTGNHEWLLLNMNLRETCQLQVGDRLRTVQYGYSKLQYSIITSIDKSGVEDVYDIVNAGDNHLFAIEANDGSKIYTHNCTTVDIDGQLLKIKTDNERVKKILHNLFYDVMNIEFNLWSWIRTMCKYGDFFLYLQIAEEFGIVNVMPIHPSLMIREEGTREDPEQVRFKYEGDVGFYSGHNLFEEYEIAHFRMLTDTNFLPYGRSVIEPGKKVYKMMTLMEDAMLISRIMRAPERRIHYIDVGNIAPEEIDAHIEQIANEMKKTPYIDQTTGDFNLRYNLTSMMEDYFLPVRGDQSGTKIDTLPGLQNEGMKEDVEYFKDKLLASLKIPKDFLGYGLESSSGKANLASLDIRFARTIERLQKIFVSELYKIAIIHLKVQGFKDEELMNFEIYLTNPSLVFERQKTDVMVAKVDLVKSIKEDNLFSDKYIYENIFGMSEDEWKADRDRVVEDAKHKFRLNQIVEEGNDPKLTGKSFGTPWDIATLQVSSKMMDGSNEESMKQLYTPDEREENQGKPPQYKSSFETKRDQDFGRDPMGRRENNKMDIPKESFQRFIKKLDKYKKYDVKKTLNEHKDISMLDDDLLFDENDIN